MTGMPRRAVTVAQTGAPALPTRPVVMWAPFRYGVFSWLQSQDQQIAETVDFLRGELMKGVTDGSSAAPGMVGEYIQSHTAPDYVLPAGVWQPVVSLLLPPGDWDIGGEVDMNPDTPAMRCTTRISLDAVSTEPSTLTGAMLSTSVAQIVHWGGNAGGDLVQRTSQPITLYGWAYCDVQVSSFYFAISGRRRR